MLKNGIKNQIIKYAVAYGLIIISGFAVINDLTPFAYATFYAAAFAGLNPMALTPALIAGVFLPDMTAQSLIAPCFACALTIAVWLVLYKNKKQPSIAIMIMIIFVGQAADIITCYFEGANPLFLVINLCLIYVYAYISYNAMRPIIRHSLKFSLLDTEIACIYLMVVVFSMGLTSLDQSNMIVLLAVAGLLIPLACKIIGKGAGVMIALSMGLGSAFTTLDVVSIAMLGFISLASSMFISSPRVLSPLAQIFAVAIFELFFDVDYLRLGYHAAAVLLGGLIYALIPGKILSVIGEKFFKTHSSTAIRHVINRNRYELSKSVVTVSKVFGEMGAIFGGMEKDYAFASSSVSGAVVSAVCKDCPHYEDCCSLGLMPALSDLAVKALEKGKPSINDIPPLLVDRCLYIGKIMSVSASAAAEQNQKLSRLKEDNKVTKLLATQMDGVSRILDKMSVITARPVSYDYELEKKVVEELKYYNIICSEALLCLGENPTATLIVRRDCAEKDSELIAGVTGKILKTPFSVKVVDDSLISGWSVVELESKLRYDVVFGVASKPLSGNSTGDTHSFMKIGGNKFLMAICDGMGSGKKAYELSNKAMTLVEGFYRAGFDHEITVEGINRFLNFEDSECFSALDVAVCDLSQSHIDLVKLAAPSSYVKRADSVIRIDSSSLPLGVVGEVSPAVSTLELFDSDVIVLTSDGVSGKFEGDTLSAFINNADGVNPQKLADAILNEAQRRRGAPEDDMTVAVCRITKRV